MLYFTTVNNACSFTVNRKTLSHLFNEFLFSVKIFLHMTKYICSSKGTLPAIYIGESMIDHLARSLGMEVETVKRANLYKQGQVTPRGYTLKYCSISTLWDRKHYKVLSTQILFLSLFQSSTNQLILRTEEVRLLHTTR